MKNFDQIVERSQAIASKWAKHDPQPWPVEVKIVDLNRIVGELSSKVLKMRGFKSLDVSSDATEELTTMLLIILDIAQDFGVDIKQVYPRLLDKFEAELN